MLKASLVVKARIEYESVSSNAAQMQGEEDDFKNEISHHRRDVVGRCDSGSVRVTHARPHPGSHSGGHPQAPAATTTSGDDSWAKVQQSGKLRVGTSADYAPFESYNAKYQIDGFDIALINEIAKQLGVTVDLNDFAFDGLGGALQVGQIDTSISAISVTPNDRRYSISATSTTLPPMRSW